MSWYGRKNNITSRLGLNMPGLYPANRVTFNGTGTPLESNRVDAALKESYNMIISNIADVESGDKVQKAIGYSAGESFIWKGNYVEVTDSLSYLEDIEPGVNVDTGAKIANQISELNSNLPHHFSETVTTTGSGNIVLSTPPATSIVIGVKTTNTGYVVLPYLHENSYWAAHIIRPAADNEIPPASTSLNIEGWYITDPT